MIQSGEELPLKNPADAVFIAAPKNKENQFSANRVREFLDNSEGWRIQERSFKFHYRENRKQKNPKETHDGDRKFRRPLLERYRDAGYPRDLQALSPRDLYRPETGDAGHRPL